MKAKADRLVQRLARSRTMFYLAAFVFLLLTAGGVLAGAANCGDSIALLPVSGPSQPPVNRHRLQVKNPSGNTFQVTCGEPVGQTPYTIVTLHWTYPPGATNVQINVNPPDKVTYHQDNHVSITLFADQTTGMTNMVTMSYDYDPPPGVDTILDCFEAGSYDIFAGDGIAEHVSRPVSGGSGRAARGGSQPTSSPAAQAADYYLWRVQMHFWPAETQTMTTNLCQDQMALLQGGHTFLALRFPVLPPTLSYTEPYTLPVVGLSRLNLKDTSVWPPTLVFTVPLEYKPEYAIFLENELPAAPGEHWLALGVVTTPTVDCASVPTLTDWEFQAEVWLDFGGTQDAGRGRLLPRYYCYEGQTPPPLLPRAAADSTAYQGWGITCVGPHPLYLESYVRPLELYGVHRAWITPTQTISFSHSIVNWTLTPLTVVLTHSSTLGLPWGFYSGTVDAPDVPLVPITGPFQVKPFGPNPPYNFWAITTVPADVPAGAETLVITATDVISPTRVAWTSDLAWVGDWVAPPGPPLWYRLYLPLVLRQGP